jgi:hypothetical protein
MKSRRNFIQKGSFATLALIAAKPFKSLANTSFASVGISLQDNKIALVHNANTKKYQQLISKKISQLNSNANNMILLETGKTNNIYAFVSKDVAVQSELTTSLTNDSYKIIYKGDIKIAIVKASAGEKNTVQRINALSSYLKKEKNCHIVVCLSQLGFKNKVVLDDIKLAQQSSNLDVIIGSNPANFSAHSFVAQNNSKEEVIIQSAIDNGFALGNIEIEFDEKQNKKNIAINNLLTRLPENN